MKNKSNLRLLILVFFILCYVFLSMFTDIFDDMKQINYLMLLIVILLGIHLIYLFVNRKNNFNLNIKGNLLNSLINSSDTVYLMFNDDNKAVYVSSNVEDVLGINCEDVSDASFKILNIPVIKEEMKNCNKEDKYVSQLLEYDNPKYNHHMWIRIKTYIYNQKKDKYYIIEISDSTKEHDKQHLLLTQATNIKTRENQLNQIISTSYDMEININLNTNTYDLKYLKKDNMYFGEEKRGTYSTDIKNIINTYVNINDRENLEKILSIKNLEEHFNLYELDSINVRYRIGENLKNSVWLESTIFFLSNKGNNKVSILTKNVTENVEGIREQNVMLQNALNDAKLVSKSKTELISTISHDIRTPLTNILGLSDELINKEMSSDIKDDIKIINDSSKEVLEIIDDLLDISKIEKKLIEKNEKQYSIYKLFNDIEENTKEYIGEKPIKFNLTLDNNLPVILYGDNRRILNALNSVINSSIKNLSEGEISVKVRGEKHNNDVNLNIEIFDNGNGMSKEDINKIMSKENNTNLGNVKKLMDLLNGKFEIESKVGEYTKFTLSFVQKIIEDNKIRTMVDNNKTAEIFSLKGKKILVVDDNKLNLKVTNKMLSKYDVDVTLLESGEECISLLKTDNTFDLILLDQMMPGMDGTTVMNTLKSSNNFNIPIVVLTADVMSGQKEKYLESGFDDYVSKPIDRSELTRVLKKFLCD